MERCIELTMEKEQLKQENASLRQKLQQAYDFMRGFVIAGRNMLEAFFEKIGEVREKVMKR